MSFVADVGGGGARVPTSLAAVTPPEKQPVSTGESDAAARARELQRQLEALLEKLREAQRRAEEAGKRAIAAQHKAEQARKAEETAKAQAEKTKSPVDQAAAKKAEQNTKLEDARLKKESADANLQDKNVTLLKAQVAQKKEQKKSADGKASPDADQKVKVAQGHRDDAQRTSDRSNLYASYQEKETKAQDAEAKVVELTPSSGRSSYTITDAERNALQTANTKATTLRNEANDAKAEFSTAVGAEAQAEFFGDPPAPPSGTAPATQPVALPNDPLHSPLQQFLQVSSRPSGLFLPLLTPSGAKAAPASADVTKTLSSIADGKSVEQIAKERGVGADKVIAEAKAAGIQLESSTPSTDVRSTTVKRGDATLTYTNDMHSGTVTVKGSFADPKAPGGRKTIEASQDGNGRFSQTVKDDKTGDTTTHVIDTQAGTRTDIVVGADGKRAETTTDLTGAPVLRPVKEGEGYLDVAKAAGLTPEQLLALNPDVDYGKPLKPGQQMVVSGVHTTVKTYNKDGSTLEETTAGDGSLTAVATNASGHRTVLMGDLGAKDDPGEVARKAIFDDRKTVAEVATSMGLTQDQVLALLPPGTVDETPASAETSGIETRTLFDPTTNRVVVETLDPRHDRYVRQDIDDKTVFKVRQYDPETKKVATVEVAGGVGYLQKQADDKLALVGDYDKQIADLDIAMRYSKRMGEPVTELQEQRGQLVALRDTVKGEADISRQKATAALAKNQQVKLDNAAAIAYQRQFVARPGSDEKKEATQTLNDILALTDKVDHLVKSADKDVEFLIAGLDQQQKHGAKVDADENLHAEFQKWKDEVWMWQSIPKDTADKMKAEGQKPPMQLAYRTEEERNEAAWEAFVSRQEFLDEHGDETLTDAERPARDAWVQSSRATTAELESNDTYYEVSIDKGKADANVIQGDIDHLQAKKDAWHNANPKDFLESFPEVKGEHGGQKELDRLNDDLTKLQIGGLIDGKDQRYNQYLKTLSATDLQDPEKLKEASQKYGEDNAKDIEKIDQNINDLVMKGLRGRAKASEEYIAQWAKDNPKLQKQLDELAATKTTNPRMADALIEQRENLLTSSHEGLQLKAALAMKWDTQFKLTQVGNDDVARIQEDLDGVSKSAEGQTWLRDVFSDTAEDSQADTQEQLDKAKQLRDDLASGKITLTEYARQQDAQMDSYGVKSIDIARELRSSDETWAVVDDAVRMTVSAAAGIGATILSGGNVAVGIAVGVGVNQLWDTSNDVYAAANGRDMYADGHSSLLTLYARSQIDPGSITSEQVAMTVKDDVVDVAHAAVSATGVGAGLRTSAALTARMAAKEGINLGAGQTLKLGSRVVVGARSGLVAQGVDGAGRVGVETLHVGLDGKLGTEEGAQRIGATAVSSAVGVFTAPLTGGVSGAIPMNKLAVGVGAQLLNDSAGSLGTGELISLANSGRHMNQGELIAASVQAIPGTMTNVALHPSVRGGAKPAEGAAGEPAAGASSARPLRLTLDSDGHTVPAARTTDAEQPVVPARTNASDEVQAAEPVPFSSDELTPMLKMNLDEHLPHPTEPRAQTVPYMTDAQRARHRVTVDGEGRLVDHRGHLLDTSHNQADDVFGRGGFVLDRNGELYYFDRSEIPVWATNLPDGHESVGSFETAQRHSSVLGGYPVAMAGEWTVRNGVVEYISNGSGHYQPTDAAFHRSLQFLHDQGLNLRHAEIDSLGDGKRSSNAGASELRRAGLPQPAALDQFRATSHPGRPGQADATATRAGHVDLLPEMGDAGERGSSGWTLDVLKHAAAHPQVQAAVRSHMQEHMTQASRAQQQELFEYFFGSNEKIIERAQDAPLYLQNLVRAGLNRLEHSGERVDIRGWTPLTTPTPEVYQIRSSRSPKLESAQDVANALRVHPGPSGRSDTPRGITEQSGRIALALERGDVKLHLLGEREFEQSFRGHVGDPDRRPPLAFARGRELYLNVERGDPLALLVDAVHEGTHALDNLTLLDVNRPYEVRIDGKVVETGTHKPGSAVHTGDKEARAFYHQIEFARALGLSRQPHDLLGATLPKDTMGASDTMETVHALIDGAYPHALREGFRMRPDPYQPPLDYQRAADWPSERRVTPQELRYTSAKTGADVSVLAADVNGEGPTLPSRDFLADLLMNVTTLGPELANPIAAGWRSDLLASEQMLLRDQWMRGRGRDVHELSPRDPLFSEITRKVLGNHEEQPYPTDALFERRPLMKAYLDWMGGRGEHAGLEKVKFNVKNAATVLREFFSPQTWKRMAPEDRPDFVITRIELLRNRPLLERFARAHDEIEARNGDSNVTLLFSGHSSEVTEAIVTGGHDPLKRGFDRMKGFGALGQGIYLTNTIDKAVSYAQKPGGESSVLLQGVVLGRTFVTTERGPLRFNTNNEMVNAARHPANQERLDGQGRSAAAALNLDQVDSLLGARTSEPGAGLPATVRDRNRFDSDEYVVRNTDQVVPLLRIYFEIVPRA